MTDSNMFHDGNRRLQDTFDSRRISDRLEDKLTRTAFTEDASRVSFTSFSPLPTPRDGRIARSRAACRASSA
jgi:hypothetical protein